MNVNNSIPNVDSLTYTFALYSYDGEQLGDLDFRSGDLLEITEPLSANKKWIKATNPRTGKIGMVPNNYLTTEQGYSAALDAFRRVDRAASETLLKSPAYRRKFNYIIRPSTDREALALSILMPNDEILHFKILFDPNQQTCFIASEESFETIEDLIVHYMDTAVPNACILQAYTPFRKFLGY